ncbi:hypothetical protein BPAE_0246g00090 [Botrytis paeoniae]|uniref:Uncharacterized protein n=1 Tax=Botrytis paeoniae TaxID=278948 RepID=A0A4Z1FEB2_9HELO|nr:hypothetical protein BPAE_0246g00090 [Botrytis paeoniae]
MESNAWSPTGLYLTWNPLDHSSRRTKSTDDLPTIGGFFDASKEAADHFIGNFEPSSINRAATYTLDEQAYDIGAAADYNAELMKRMDDKIDGLALTAFLTNSPWDTLYTTKPLTEAQFHVPVGPNIGDSCVPKTTLSEECDVDVSMVNFEAADYISSQPEKLLPPTPLINHEDIPGQIATRATVLLSLHNPQNMSGPLATNGSKPGVMLRVDISDLMRLPSKSYGVACPVYGCHRTTKPFKRADKFMAHFRKHDNSQSYRCLIETCQCAPFDIPGLIDHLAKKHYMDHEAQANLDFTTITVLKIRSIPFWLGRVFPNGRDICPLAAIGCTYRVTADTCEHYRTFEFIMEEHIFTHELSRRLQGKELLRDFFTGRLIRFLDNGARNCMLCSFQASGCFHREILFAHLLSDHSKEERRAILPDIHPILDTHFDRFWRFHTGENNVLSIVLGNECRAAGFTFDPWHDSLFLDSKGT